MFTGFVMYRKVLPQMKPLAEIRLYLFYSDVMLLSAFVNASEYLPVFFLCMPEPAAELYLGLEISLA